MKTAAKHLIERYLFEIAPSFDGQANWEKIWAIERRFGMIGYGDHLERIYRRTRAEANVKRARTAYEESKEGDAWLFLRDAQLELNEVSS